MNDPADQNAEQTPIAPMSQPGAHEPPSDLDYAVVRLIGRGGYGEVWLVRDKDGEHRACKVIYRESFQHARPYEREYEGIRKFEPVSRASESQVKILYVGLREAAGYFFYIMELADDASGAASFQAQTYQPKTLQGESKRRGRLPVHECIQIGISLCAALENLHQHGLIHRDIKPANIIFVKGVPKLADIGLVTEADVTVSYVGTAGFIPPEGPTSPKADVYALGKVLYEIGTGKDRLDYPELPADFGEWPDHETMLEFNAVVARACEADPRKRYASASAMRADLERLQSGKSIRRRDKTRRTLAWVGTACCLLLAVFVAVYLIRSQPPAIKMPTVRRPMPDASRLAQSESRLRETYQAQLAGGNSAQQQQAAFELLERGGVGEDTAVQLASLRLAALLAAKAGNFSLAMQACDAMTAAFPVNAIRTKADCLQQACNDEQNKVKRPELAGLCIRTGFEAIGADDYEVAAKLSDAAAMAATNTDRRLIHEIKFFDSELAKCREGFARVRTFSTVLKSQPNNPEANLAVGKFLCFVKNDWEAGLPLLARGTNQSIHSVATEELNQKTKTPEECAALANAWGKLADDAGAEDKIHFYQRARYWTLKVIIATKEPEKDRYREQLARWLQSAPTEPGEIHLYSRVAGTETIDIFSDEVVWKSGRGALNSRINEAQIGELKAGDIKVIKNTEASRFMPENVDFSTARLTVNHKPKRQGQAKLELRADHLHITLSHSRAGYAEVDVTVTFGPRP